MFGLDDLRQWTLNNSIQSHVDVYLNADTMGFVRSVFPYLVDTSKASGGGDVAGIRFHVLDAIKSDDGTQDYLPVEIDGVTIQPFEGMHAMSDRIANYISVEHGKIGDDPFMCLGFRIDGVTYLSDVVCTL
jgi:hypothetical protein